MHYAKPVFSLLVVLMMLAFTFSAAVAQGEAGLEGLNHAGNQPGADTAPLPLYPNAKVYDLTPTFYFSQLYGATKYKIEVWNDYTDALVYTYKGVACQAAGVPCELTPEVKLKALDYTDTKGLYRWRVKAKIEGKWQPDYSSEQTFTVMSPGFYHTFSYLPAKWMVLRGDWLVNKSGYLKTLGTPGAEVSVFHKEVFEDTDYHPVFEVVMKRKVDEPRENGILVAGIPGTEVRDGWTQGYVLSYSNDGNYHLYQRYSDGPSESYCHGSVPGLINAYGWNKLTIWHRATQSLIYVNGLYVGQISDTTFTAGWVGVQMTQRTSDKTPLLVDYAKVYYTSTGPQNVIYPEASVLDPAATWPADQIPTDALDQ